MTIPTRSCRDVFNSRTPQRPIVIYSAEVGPGTYNPKPGAGMPCLTPWLKEPLRQGSAFASKSQKTPEQKTLAADVEYAPPEAARMSNLPKAPGSAALKWPHGERKPPHFHVPFRAYPSQAGDPRGREKGLDLFYDLDAIAASPVALNGTLAVNMVRHPRRYATIGSRVPARPRHSDPGSAGGLGPGSYTLSRDGISLKDPCRPSSAFIPGSRGKFDNVGGSYAEWLGIDLRKREAESEPGTGSRERRRGHDY